MGKTLKRLRARQLKEQQQQQQHQEASLARPCKLPRLAGGPQLNAGSSSSKFTAAVSAAMRDQDWLAALQALQAMTCYNKVPKLGAIQRWVRDADQAGDEAVTARLIDAILRCTVPREQQQQQQSAKQGLQQQDGSHKTDEAAAAAAADVLEGSIKRHRPWLPELPPAASAAADAGSTLPSVKQENGQQQQQQAGVAAQQQTPPNYAELLYQVPFQPGAGGPDAIFAYPPNSVLQFDPQHPPAAAVPVPFVPGASCLLGVLSAAECKQIVAAAEAIGYNANVDYTFGGALGGDGGAEAGGTSEQQQQQQQQQQEEDVAAVDDPAPAASIAADTAAAGTAAAAANGEAASPAAAAAAAAAAAQQQQSAARGHAAELVGLQQGGPAQGCVWLVDDSVLLPLYNRVKHLLPQELGGGALAGINARWRLYRYTPGNVYRPHIDGAWPGSGLDSNGHYVFDAYGDRWSRLTFLVYLNDDFEGGATTYYTASEQQEGRLDARGVQPVTGNVMVFPHGGTLGSLVHEGSAVLQGAKYVIRTDVLYMKAQEGGRRLQKQQGEKLQQGGRKRQRR